MSKIFKSDSVKALEVKASTSFLETGKFRTLKVEGTYTQDEVEEKIRIAKEEAAVIATKVAEERLAQPLRNKLQDIEVLLEQFSKFRRELFKESEQEVLSFVSALAKKVIGRELSIKPEIMLDIVTKALESLEHEKHVTLLIHPRDYDLFAKAKPDFDEKLKHIEKLELYKDQRIAPGNVVIKTKQLEVETDAMAMVDQLMGQLKSELETTNEVNNPEDTL